MANNSNENKNGLKDKAKQEGKNMAKNAIKKIALHVAATIAPVVIIILLLVVVVASIIDFLTIDTATYQEGDQANVPYAVNQFINNVSIDANGNITSTMTVQQLWDDLVSKNSAITEYLQSPDELMKLISAEIVTAFPDTRDNPDEPIDWNSINNANSNQLQRIIKFKRQKSDQTTTTMKYVPQSEFNSMIADFNAGDTSKKDEILNSFTLEQTQVTTSTTTTTSGNTTTSGTSTTPITSTANMQLMIDDGYITFYKPVASEGGEYNFQDYLLSDGQVAMSRSNLRNGYENAVIYIETATEGEGSYANGKYFYVTDTGVTADNHVDVCVMDLSQDIEAAPYGDYEGAKIYLVEQNVSFQDYQTKYLGLNRFIRGYNDYKHHIKV